MSACAGSKSETFDALRRGVDDFMVKPSHVAFIVVIYPLVGVVLRRLDIVGRPAPPMLFPLMSGASR